MGACLCDDIPAEIENMLACLADFAKTNDGFLYATKTYTHAQDLLNTIQSGNQFDLLLLDIYLTDKSGIDCAKELRSLNFNGQIIFLSTSKDHIFAAFSVDATQYLIKPYSKDDFFAAMAKALAIHHAKCPKHFTFTAKGRLHKIAIADIVFTESANKHQLLHMADGKVHHARMSTKELSAKLPSDTFVGLGKTYIVNLSYILSMDAKMLTLYGDTVLYFPRGSYAECRERYFKFLL